MFNIRLEAIARKMIPTVSWAVLLSSLLGSPSSAPLLRGPQDTLKLSLREARARALFSNPDLGAARLDTVVARGEYRQAGLLFPANPSAGFLGGGEGTEFELSQEVEIAGQQAARRMAGRAGLERAAAGVSNVARLTLADVDRTFYRLAAAARRTVLAEEVAGLNRRLAEVTQRQLEAGEISRLEFNLATVELGRSQARLLAERREREATAAELRQLLGVPRGVVIAPLLDSTPALTLSEEDTSQVVWASTPEASAVDLDSLTALALARRPDIAERTAAARQAQAQLSVARREAFPNLAFRATSEVIDDGTRAFRPGVGLTLPLFNRNRGEVQVRRALAAQVEFERDALVTQVRLEVDRALQAHEAAAAEARVLATAVLIPARTNRRLLETAYREGKVGLAELLLIRNQVIDAELEYWAAWLTERETLADLAEATGEIVPPLPPRAARQ